MAAEVLGEEITIAEVDAQIKEELFAKRTRGDSALLFEIRSETLERMIDARLLKAEADRRGMLPEELAGVEARERDPVSDEEVAAFWEQHRAGMGGTTLEQAEPAIRRYLERRRTREVVPGLRDRAGVVVRLAIPRVEVAPDGPARGPSDALVTIVQFSDFECPYCKRSVATIERILERYPDDVRVVYRHLPLEHIHRRARFAAEAAACADEQGKFWPYHAKLFQNSPALERADLLRYATEVGIDSESFSACFDERRCRKKVDADVKAARAIGIDGTPGFVINGIVMTGAKAEDLYRVIEAELGTRRSS